MNNVKVKWPLIVTEYDKTYFNYIDLGNYTMFRMAIFKTRFPRPGMFVAIEDKGSFFFGIGKHLHKDYVAAKIGLLGDAGQVADFLNAQLEIDGNQQGHYYDEIINSVRPYGKILEQEAMPWKPIILEDENAQI